MANMKSEFISWMNSTQNDKGQPYSEDTSDNYVKSLETHLLKLEGLGLEDLNVLNIDNLRDFGNAEELIKAHPQYKTIRTRFTFKKNWLTYKIKILKRRTLWKTK